MYPIRTQSGLENTYEPSTYSQILAVELKQYLIPTLVLLSDPIILEVPTSRHPAMNLVAESLNVVIHRQILAELFDGIGVFVAGREHAEGHLDAFGVGGVDHGGVDFGDGGE